MSLYTYDLISHDAQIALTQFSEQFIAALTQSPVTQWSSDLGFALTSKALKTRFPLPIDAAGYKELKGDLKYRRLGETSLELTPKTWQDGVEELASVIEAPDWIGWTVAPAAMAAAGASLMNEIIVDLLETNASSPAHPLTGGAFFKTGISFNVLDSSLGTFDNDLTGGGTSPTIGNIKQAKENFRAIKAANGKPMGLRMTHVLVPAAQEETWRDLLEQDLIIQAGTGSTFGSVDNRHKGTVQLIVSDELTDDSKWYALALNKPGMVPWIIQDDGAPEEIMRDKSSDFYKSTLKVSLAYVKRANGALALPQCIQRWAGNA